MFTDCKPASAEVNITVSTGSVRDWRFAKLAEVAPRFWAKVRRGGDDECWLWTASVSGTGFKYGQFTLPRSGDGRQPHVKAHRLAWILTHGPIPDGFKVCHRCDVPLCVNPTHLFLGTQAENLADCRRKGRMPRERNAKLSISDRAAIRTALVGGARQIDVARRYGVSRALISRMARVQFADRVQQFFPQSFQSPAPPAQQANRHSHFKCRAFDLGHAAESAPRHAVPKADGATR